MTPLWLGVVGFGLAVVALSWTIVSTALGWPRIRVARSANVRLTIGSSPSPPLAGSQYSFLITVINLGSEAATIEDVGFRVRSKGFANISVQQLRGEGVPMIIGADLPCRIDGHGTGTWTVPGPLFFARLARDGDGEVFAWAERYAWRPDWPWRAKQRVSRRRVESETFPYP